MVDIRTVTIHKTEKVFHALKSINSAIFFPLIYCPAYFLFLICTSGIATFS